MTKATRLGVSALMVIGGLALGAFAGCSDDDPVAPPVDTDSGTIDTGTPDTFRPDMGTDTAKPADAETGPVEADRAATLVFASPDLGGKLVCLAAFLDGTDPATTDPFQTLPGTGAIGVPDSAAPTDTTKTTAFPYGAVVPIPLSDTAVAALENFNVVAFLVDANPAATMKTCKDVWKDNRGDASRWKAFPKQSIKSGEHGVIAFQGCKTAAGCGMGAFEIKLHKVSMAKPTEMGANVGFQFIHLSQFASFETPNPLDAGPATLTVPGFQGSDVYVVPGPDTADAGAAAFIKIAENVSYNGAVTALKGATLPAGTMNDASRLVIATRLPMGDAGASGSYPCANPIATGQAGSPPSGTCPNWTFYLKPFFDGGKYPLLGAGLQQPNSNQVFIIAGNPVAPTGMMPSLRIMAARGSMQMKTW